MDGLAVPSTKADAAVTHPDPPDASARTAYPPAAELPTQTAPLSIRFDFNLGCRVVLPQGDWRSCLRDIDTGYILFQSSNTGAFVNKAKRRYIRFRSEVWDRGEHVFRHDYDAEGRDVPVQFPVGTLGDTMGWFPYAVKLQQRHRCRLTCAMSGLIIPLFRDAYPKITFVTHEEVRAEQFYATYSIGLFFDDAEHIWQPCDFRHVGLHRTAGYILGVDPEDAAPRRAFTDDGPPIAEPYVCIAVQSSSQCKYWNNPAGWREIVSFLKSHGYRVICIDQKPMHGRELVWDPHPPRGGGRDRRPAVGRADALAPARRVLCRPVERPVLGGLGSQHSGGADQRLHPNDQRIPHAVAGHQLPRMQRLLERSACAVRPQGFPVVPAPARHATPVRMHTADHVGPDKADDRENPRIWHAGSPVRAIDHAARRRSIGMTDSVVSLDQTIEADHG